MWRNGKDSAVAKRRFSEDEGISSYVLDSVSYCATEQEVFCFRMQSDFHSICYGDFYDAFTKLLSTFDLITSSATLQMYQDQDSLVIIVSGMDRWKTGFQFQAGAVVFLFSSAFVGHTQSSVPSGAFYSSPLCNFMA
jgi:hypothetical protein